MGDVYLAGGQSNMEMELRNAAGGAEQAEEDPLLRFYNVPRKAVVNEEQQRAVRDTRWQPVTRENAGFNSAAATLFGMRMRRKHPEIPVGIIGCYWGGTSVTCWMDEETLRTLTEGIRYLDVYAQACGGKSMETYLEEERKRTGRSTRTRIPGKWKRRSACFRGIRRPGRAPRTAPQAWRKAC